jgi:hypothetical protein
MTIIKRQGYPDITDEDLKQISYIHLEMTPINPVRHEWKGPKPMVLPDLIVIAHIPETRECIKTTIVGDEYD